MAPENREVGRDYGHSPQKPTAAKRNCPKCGLAVSDNFATCPNDGTPLNGSGSLSQISYLAGQYEFIEEIGSGGMGVIYKARHLGLNKLVAIKMLHANRTDSATLLRFQQEARAVSNLDHPSIVRIRDFGVSESGQPHMVFDFIDGQDLDSLLKKEGAMPFATVTNIFCQICDAIEHAHQHGVLHRDLKPSNCMLVTDARGDLQVKIVDFGIAKIMDPLPGQGMNLTQTGEVFGSPLYMSPEQATGEKLDRRSDVYSAGCLLFELLTGAPPYVAKNSIDTIMKHCNAPIPTLQEASLGLKFPLALEDVVQKSLAKDPQQRYQTMREMKEAYLAATSNRSAVAKSGLISGQTVANKSSWRKIVPVSAVALLTSGGIIFYVVSHSHQNKVGETNTLGGNPLKEGEQELAPSSNRTARSDSTLNVGALGGASRETSTTSDTASGPDHTPSSAAVSSGNPSNPVNSTSPQATKQPNPALDAQPAQSGGVQEDFNKTLLDSLGGEHRRIFAKQMHDRKVTANLVAALLSDEDLEEFEKADPAVVREVYLEHVPISGVGLKHLIRLPITRLSLNYAERLSPEGMKYLNDIGTLRDLRLDKTPVTDDVLRELYLRNLKSLSLRDTHISGRGLECLTRLPKLEQLDLGACSLSNADMHAVGTLNRLKDLCLWRDTYIDDTGFASLRSCSALEDLDLSATNITNKGLVPLYSLKNLKRLNVSGCPYITADGVRAFKKACPNTVVTSNYNI